MNQSLPARFSAATSVRAFLALFVALLQLVGALHFTLVSHGYSAALGGVVHVHSLSRAQTQPSPRPVAQRTTALAGDAPSCGAELCPLADAPHGSAPRIELLAAGSVAFGDARLLSERAAYSSESAPVFLSAPKTSPPA